jgi:hypothetical protein
MGENTKGWTGSAVVWGKRVSFLASLCRPGTSVPGTVTCACAATGARTTPKHKAQTAMQDTGQKGERMRDRDKEAVKTASYYRLIPLL